MAATGVHLGTLFVQSGQVHFSGCLRSRGISPIVFSVFEAGYQQTRSRSCRQPPCKHFLLKVEVTRASLFYFILLHYILSYCKLQESFSFADDSFLWLRALRFYRARYLLSASRKVTQSARSTNFFKAPVMV
jgi:hypothetical protein